MSARVSFGRYLVRRSLLGLLALALVQCRGAKREETASTPAAQIAAPSPIPTTPLAPAPGIAAPASFADLAAQADPAVVFVKTTQAKRAGFRVVMGQGVGSAFVFDPKGLILTNYHVIEDAHEIWVQLGKRKEIRANVVGVDPPTDIAILRVEEQGLHTLALGDSDAIRVGDWVVAIGNPFGLSHTVSAGIISAKDRTNSDVTGLNENGYYDFLQTDASINPGNSGGPLLDTAGRVVGINTAIRAQANSIGFAIPINMVKELLPRLLKDGRLERSAIGVSISSIPPDAREKLKLQSDDGVLIQSVLPRGPAASAGLRPGDVITAVEGQPIATPDRLRWKVSLAGIGSEVKLSVWREGESFETKVKLEKLVQRPNLRVEEAEPGPGWP